MKTLTTTLLILVTPLLCSYSQTASSPSPTPTMTPATMAAPAATPYRSTSASMSPAATPFSAGGPTTSFGDEQARMRDLDRRMDTIFDDAFRNAGEWQNHSAMASSINLREQKNKYIARVYLPHFDTSKAQVKVENGNLHIVANSENTGNGNTEGQKYEQTISLPQPVQSDKIQVQRKPDLLVITVPKQTGEQPGVASTSATPSGTESESAAKENEWENSIANEFARMNKAMDRAFNETFPNSFGIGPRTSQLESAVKMDDEKDKYVVHFYLPEENVSNVRVNFDNGELHLRANETSSETSQQSNQSSQQQASETSSQRAGESSQQQAGESSQQPSGSSEKVTGEYTATITVPGPVNEEEMKVDRQANAVVVTLPKA